MFLDRARDQCRGYVKETAGRVTGGHVVRRCLFFFKGRAVAMRKCVSFLSFFFFFFFFFFLLLFFCFHFFFFFFSFFFFFFCCFFMIIINNRILYLHLYVCKVWRKLVAR